MWCFQSYHKEKWWHLSGFWVTVVNFKSDDEAEKFAKDYNNDPYTLDKDRMRLVFLVNKSVQKEIKLRKKKYETWEASVQRIFSGENKGSGDSPLE